MSLLYSLVFYPSNKFNPSISDKNDLIKNVFTAFMDEIYLNKILLISCIVLKGLLKKFGWDKYKRIEKRKEFHENNR